MQQFPDLVRRHNVTPGPLVHVGGLLGDEIEAYYEAGFYDITVVRIGSDVARRHMRNRFPGVDVRDGVGLDATAPAVLIINTPGQELEALQFTPWDDLRLIVVETTDNAASGLTASQYDLVTEAITTRGFVEVDRWTRSDVGGLRVAFMSA